MRMLEAFERKFDPRRRLLLQASAVVPLQIMYPYIADPNSEIVLPDTKVINPGSGKTPFEFPLGKGEVLIPDNKSTGYLSLNLSEEGVKTLWLYKRPGLDEIVTLFLVALYPDIFFSIEVEFPQMFNPNLTKMDLRYMDLRGPMLKGNLRPGFSNEFTFGDPRKSHYAEIEWQDYKCQRFSWK